ncbi:MAG: hypothetical protein J5602_04280 [Clostridia bacterium]|nr:hypothetical protein [Clostridia bacterium]
MDMMLKVDPEFAGKIPPISDEEFRQLRENILEAGEVYEPIVTWNGVIVDGHNRWKVIQENPEVRWRTREMEFADKWAAFSWMYRNQLGRRNLTDEQRTYTIGKLYEARKNSIGGDRRSQDFSKDQNDPLKNDALNTAAKIDKEVGVAEPTVKRADLFAKGVDAIREANPEAADKILAGKSGLTKQEVREIKNMEPEEVEKITEAVIAYDATKPKSSEKSNAIAEVRAQMRQIREMVQKSVANRSAADEPAPDKPKSKLILDTVFLPTFYPHFYPQRNITNRYSLSRKTGKAQ